MTVIASGEIDLKLSAKALAGLENSLAKVSNDAGRKLDKELSSAGSSSGASAGSNFSKAFTGKLGGIKDSIGKAFSNISPGQIAGGVATAGAAIAAFAAKSIAHFSDTAQSVRGFQRVTGESAGEASQFVAAFDDMGISAEKASGAMFKLSKNIAAGGETLTKLGIEIGHSKDGAVDLKDTFLNVADAVAGTEDPTRRSEIAFAAFGKQGQALLPILEKGKKGIEELFKGADLNFTQKQLDQAEDYRLAMDRLGDSFGKVQNTIGGALVPKVTAGANAFASLVDKVDSGAKSVGGLGGVFDTVLNTAIPGSSVVLGLFGEKAEETSLSADQLAAASVALGASTESLTCKTKDQVLALLDEKKAFEDMVSAQLAAFDANFAYEDSLNASEDAAAAVVEKQNALNEAIKAHTANSPEAAAASEALSRALLAQQEQALRTAESAGRVAEQQAILGGATDVTIPKLDAQIAALERSKSQVDARNIPTIQAMIDKLNAVKRDYSPTIGVNDRATPTIQSIQARLDRLIRGGQITIGGIGSGGGGINWMGRERAVGGAVWGGDWLVGERGNGAEHLHLAPGSRGFVTNAQRTEQMLSGGSQVTQNITVNEVSNDPQATAFAVAARLGERSQR